jgi:hypothetical protein
MDLDRIEPASFGFDAIEVAPVFGAENEILGQMVSTHAKKVSALQQQRPRIAAEMALIADQTASAERRVNFIKSRTNELEQAFKRGYVRRNIYDDQARAQASAEGEVAAFQAQRSRLEREAADLDMRIEDAEAHYRRSVLVDLQDARQRLNELEVTLTSAREMREVKAVDAADADSESARTIEITRIDFTGTPRTFVAQKDTIVQPGDVIDVKVRARSLHARTAEADQSGLGDVERRMRRLASYGNVP